MSACPVRVNSVGFAMPNGTAYLPTVALKRAWTHVAFVPIPDPLARGSRGQQQLRLQPANSTA